MFFRRPVVYSLKRKTKNNTGKAEKTEKRKIRKKEKQKNK